MNRATLAALLALSACTPAGADEPAVTLTVPARESVVDLGTRSMPDATLDAEVLLALERWTGQPDDALVPWAHAIADGAADRREAVQLAAIAANESKMLPWVLDGRCNDAAWRATRSGWQRSSCDNGFAVSAFQRHSLALLGASPEAVVADAVKWLRAWPQAWTTWRAARAQADAWLAAR